jgi:hypothetical protein
MSWTLQTINNGGNTSGPAAVQVPFASLYNSQQHVAYRDSAGNISWYDPSRNNWNLQKINNGGNTAGPSAFEGPFVGVLHSQQHFTYIDNAGNLWDSWYDGPNNRWTLQKINNGGSTSGPPARFGSWANWVSVWVDGSGEQQHFTYIGADQVIQDAFWDGGGGKWHLQKIHSGGNTSGPPAASSPAACVYNGQQHISYGDSAGNIWDSWYYPSNNSWNLQKINAGGNTVGPASFPNTRPFVWVWGNQQHFSYLGADNAIYDPFWDGDSNSWHFQKINSEGATSGPPSIGAPFASVYNGQQHIGYMDNAADIWDSWYNPSNNSWNLQKINNGGMTTGPGAAHGTCIWVWNAQQHFTYVDASGSIWDSWYDGYVPPVTVTVSQNAIVINYNIDLGGPDTGSITGWANLTLGPDGSYNYSGAVHNSNVADYNVAVVFAIGCKSVPTVFSFGVQQSVGGDVNPFGSHDWELG